MRERKIETPLLEVRKWKKRVCLETKGLSPEETVSYFRKGAEEVWKDHGYRCIPIDKKSCKHV